MRIPFPIRIPLSYSCGFAIVLCVIELLEGTPLLFSLYAFVFILIATIAFNTAGGFSRPSGAYIFFYATLGVIIGLTYKGYLGERADSHLAVPETTMLVYVVGITAMLGAAYLKKVFLPTKGLLEDMVERIDLNAASIGCMALGIAIYVTAILTVKVGNSAEERYANNSGTVISALSQVNQFVPLGIILGVTYTIRISGGRRFLSRPVGIVTLLAMIAFGIIGTSKQALFQFLACVMVAAAALRYKFSKGQVLAFGLSMVFIFYYIVPYIYIGKAVVPADTFLGTAENAYNLLTDLGGARERMLEQTQGSLFDGDDYSIHYFDNAEGIFDRLQMISIDDALIDVTEQGHVFGLTPLLYDVYNLVPHFIWPNKPLIALGNIYSHEIGIAHYSTRGDDDATTGISFSPTADAFHMARWTGLLVIAPILWFCCFFVMDLVCGDTRRSPWGLLLVALCAHIAPEGMMSGPFYLMTIGTLMIVFVSLLAAYVLPVIGNIVARRKKAEEGATVRSRPASRSSALRTGNPSTGDLP